MGRTAIPYCSSRNKLKIKDLHALKNKTNNNKNLIRFLKNGIYTFKKNKKVHKNYISSN